MKTLATSLMCVLILAGCATNRPVGEVRLVAQAFDNLNSASQPLLDELALAERLQGKSAAEARASAHARSSGVAGGADRCPTVIMIQGAVPLQNGFCPEDSYYYSELADPPATRAFRQALAATGDYTRLLTILAEDRNMDAAMAQLAGFTANLGQAAGAAGAAGVGSILNGLLQAFNPVLEIAGQRGNAQELKRLVVQESPKVQALVRELRTQAGEFFATLAEAPLARFNLAIGNPDVARAEAARIEAYRAAISSYVVLLDQYATLLGDLVKVYGAPRGSLTLADLSERSARLSAQADAWRRSLAGLRAGLH